MKAKAVAVKSDRSRASPRVRRGPHADLRAAMLARRPGLLLQPALEVGAAHDPLELEAERTAERVVSMPAPEPAPPAAAAAAGDGAPDGVRRSADDQPNLDSLEGQPELPADHQEPTVAAEEDVDAAELGGDDLKEIESGQPADPGIEPPPPDEPIEPSPFPPVQPARSGERAVVGAEGGPAPASVAARVAQAGAGRPLPGPVRRFMEPRFGRDFSRVRLHDQPADRAAARRIGARAFTHRRDIWLGPGESVEDRRLLAHELTHVVQQTGPGEPADQRRDGVERQITTSAGAAAPVRRGYLADKAESYARNVPGYTLITVLLGKSPITGDRVARTATNLIGGFLGLLPGGNLLFERLQESRALEKAFDWVSGRLASLNITWSRVSGLIDDVIDLFPTWSPIEGIKRIFRPLVNDLLTFVGEIKDKILEFIIKGALSLAGPYAEKVWGVIEKARDTISTILEDPLAFAKNLFAAVLKGFNQFGTNILEHLKKGLMGWLFGALQGLEIKIPEKLDFKGLISIGLQILGLTYDNFRKRLVKKLGPKGEQKVAFLEKSVEVVKILVTEGFVGIWQKMLTMIDSFKETLIGGIQNFVMVSLVKGGLSWLAGLSNPVGAVVKVVLSIYNMIVTFLERLEQILEVANSIFSSIGAIAAGKIQQAADFVEKTMSATIPVVISFLAALVPVTGITSSIRKIIKKLRQPVDKAIDKLLDFVFKKAKKLLAKVIGKLNSKRKLPSANFKIGKRTHRYFVDKKGRKADVYVESSKQTTDEAEKGMKSETAKFKEGSASEKEATAATETFDKQEDQAEKVADTLQPGDTKVNQEGPNKKMQKTLADGAKVISEKGQALADNPDVDTSDPKLLIRAVEPRFDTEGKVDAYAALKKLSGTEAPGMGLKYSAFYEADHLPEKSMLQNVKAKAVQLAADKAAEGEDGQEKKSGAAGGETVRATDDATTKAGAADEASQKPRGFGQLDALADEVGGDGKSLQAVMIYRPVHREKPNTFAKATLKRIDEVLATKESPVAKEASIKAAMGQQVHDEAAAVKKLYTQLDKNSAGDVRKRVFAGLDKIVDESNKLYDLAAAKAKHSAKDVGKGGEKGERNELTFGGSQKFAEREGETRSYGTFDATGPFYERDHIIDQAYPTAVNQLKVGDDQLWALTGIDALTPPLAAADPAASDEKAAADEKAAKAAMSGRKSTLRNKDLFPAGPLRDYTEGKGLAMLVYRPVHRRVTGETRSGGAKSEILDEVKKKDPFGSAREYVQGLEGSSPTKAAAGIRAAFREPFVAQTEHHIDAVEKFYNQEADRVRKANPGKEKEAAAAMAAIRAKVDKGLAQMRQQTTSFFK